MWAALSSPSASKGMDISLPSIHFITHVFPTNVADMAFNAGVYFKDLFFAFPCIWHNIMSVEFDMIKPTDWVVFSGGDVYHSSDAGLFNKLIFQTGGRVVTWGCGYNLQDGADRKLDKSLNKEGFALFTTRDYMFMSAFGNPERYLPCVSCMQPGFGVKSSIDREIGIIEHRWYPLEEFKDYPKINNAVQSLQILHFIASSRVIVTNSYHMTYWATLLGKKVVLFGKYASKFDYFKYPPTMYTGDLREDIDRATIYPDALEECREMNLSFAKEVLCLIREDDRQPRDLRGEYSEFMESADHYLSSNDLKERVEKLYRHLDIVNGRIDEAGERIREAHENADNAHKRVDQVNKRVDEAHKNADHAHTRIDQLNERADEISQSIELTNGLIDEAHKNADNAHKRIDQLNVRVDETSQGIDLTNGRIDEAHKNADNAHKRIDQLNVRVDETSQGIELTNGLIDEAHKNTDNAHRRVDQVNGRVDEAHKNADDAHKRVDQVNERVDEVNLRINQTDERLSKNGVNRRIGAIQHSAFYEKIKKAFRKIFKKP